MTATDLSALGINNPHNVAREYEKLFPGTKVVFVMYRPQESGRARLGAAWQVRRLGYLTDNSESNYWRNHGQKTFDVHDARKDKAPQLAAALEWAGKRYGVTEWERCPRLTGGSTAYFPKPVVVWLKNAISAQRIANRAADRS